MSQFELHYLNSFGSYVFGPTSKIPHISSTCYPVTDLG